MDIKKLLQDALNGPQKDKVDAKQQDELLARYMTQEELTPYQQLMPQNKERLEHEDVLSLPVHASQIEGEDNPKEVRKKFQRMIKALRMK